MMNMRRPSFAAFSSRLGRGVLLSALLLPTTDPRAQTAPQTVPQAAAQPSQPVVNLPSVTVSGQGDGTSGPASVGYVARRDTTATKTDTPLLTTPQSIHVVTRDEIDQQDTQTVRTLLRYLPGVNYSNDANNRLDSITARGFTIDQYLDGLRLQGGTWAVPKVEPFLLDSAELLLGPASVLYGQASPGGLLNMESRLPTEQATHELLLEGGSNGFGRVGIDLSGKLNDSGTLLGRFTGTGYTDDTQVNHQLEQRVVAAPSITWKPDDRTTITLQGSYLYDPHAGFWDQLPLQGTVLPNRYGQISPSFFVGDDQYENFTRKQASLGYQIAHRFDDQWSFKQNMRYMNINTDYQEIQGSVLGADQHTLSRNAYSSQENLNTVALDNRLEGHVRTGPLTHDLLFGLDYQYSNWHNFTRFGSAPSLDILNPNNNQAALFSFIPPPVFQNAVQVQNQLGVYAQDQIGLGGFNLLLAGRQDWYDNDTLNRLTSTDTDASSKHFSGHVGLNYVFPVGIAPYVSYSTSFQPASGTSRTGTAFVPTTGEQVEVGVKYKPRGVNALFSAALFDVTQNNVLTPDPVNVLYNVQTGQVRSRGLELAAVTSPLPGLSLRASYTYLDNQITKSNTAGAVGERMPTIPANTGALWGAYTMQSGALEGLTFGAGVRYVGSAYNNAPATVKYPGYATADAMASYDLRHVAPRLAGATLQVNAYNISDERYVSVCGTLGCYYGLGRTVIGGLRYRW
jgi:iron complex outermembrane recepter protein